VPAGAWRAGGLSPRGWTPRAGARSRVIGEVTRQVVKPPGGLARAPVHATPCVTKALGRSVFLRPHATGA